MSMNNSRCLEDILLLIFSFIIYFTWGIQVYIEDRQRRRSDSDQTKPLFLIDPFSIIYTICYYTYSLNRNTLTRRQPGRRTDNPIWKFPFLTWFNHRRVAYCTSEWLFAIIAMQRLQCIIALIWKMPDDIYRFRRVSTTAVQQSVQYLKGFNCTIKCIRRNFQWKMIYISIHNKIISSTYVRFASSPPADNAVFKKLITIYDDKSALHHNHFIHLVYKYAIDIDVCI